MHAPDPRYLVDMERRVLGAAMLDVTAAATLRATFPAGRFADPEHIVIALAIERLAREGHAPSHDNLLSRELGGDRLDFHALSAAHAVAGAPESIAHDIDLLNRAWAARALRDLIERGHARARDAVSGKVDALAVAAALQQEITALTLQASGEAARGTAVGLAVDEAQTRVDQWERGEATDYSPSGFYTFDRTLGGYPSAELTTLAGFTGSGKTALVCQIVRSVALAEAAKAGATGQRPAPVVVFSAEMTREQLVQRIAAGMCGLNIRNLRARRDVTAEDYQTFRATLERIRPLPIEVDDEPAPTFAHIHARLSGFRQSAPDGRLALVAVDYDEKVNTEGKSEELRVSAIARGLKDTAKRFNVAVLGLSQYSRQTNAHTMMPQDDWLRYSGKKEQESAMIVHWMHPGYWVEKGHKGEDVARYDFDRPERGYLVVTKNRFGPTGQVPLDFHAPTTSFTDPSEPGAAETRHEPRTRTITTYGGGDGTALGDPYPSEPF